MTAKMIFIEGTDRSGKGSLMQAIHKATNYKHVIFDRGPISNLVYATANGRLTPELQSEYEDLEKQIAKTRHIVLYLECGTKELQRRMKETNHEHVDFASHKKLFNMYSTHTPLKVMKIDTTRRSPEEIVEILAERGII